MASLFKSKGPPIVGPSGCVPFRFGESAVNHHMLVQRPIMEELFRTTEVYCKDGEDSFAQLMAGATHFGCGIKPWWPTEWEQYVLFLKMYYPGAYVTVEPPWIDSAGDCSPVSQEANADSDVIYMACHSQHNTLHGVMGAVSRCVNSKTGCSNGNKKRFENANCYHMTELISNWPITNTCPLDFSPATGPQGGFNLSWKFWNHNVV